MRACREVEEPAVAVVVVVAAGPGAAAEEGPAALELPAFMMSSECFEIAIRCCCGNTVYGCEAVASTTTSVRWFELGIWKTSMPG